MEVLDRLGIERHLTGVSWTRSGLSGGRERSWTDWRRADGRWTLHGWTLRHHPLASCSADLPLLLVIEGKPERVPEGHQGSLHGIRLGLLDGGFMGLAQIHVDAVAGAASLSDQRRPATGSNGDANPGGVGDTPAGLLLPTDRALTLGHAADGDGLALPAVKAKDPIGLGDGDPSLHVGDLPAALLALADVGPIEGGGESGELLGGEPRGLCRVGLLIRGGFVGSCWRNFGPIRGADQLQGRGRPLDGSRGRRAAEGAGPVGGRSGDGHSDGKR